MRNLLAALILATAAIFLGTQATAQTAATAPTQFVQVGDDRIAYRSIGTGDPIILLNRMRGTLDTWDPLFLDTLARNHRVVTVDYPGVAYSTGALPPDIGKAAEFVADFATAIELPRFAVLGWSWGGFVSQTLLLAHPERVSHAILVGTNPPGPGQIPIQQAFLERAFNPVNDLDDEEVLFFEPRSAVSREAARASRERIYARPDVVSRIPATPQAVQTYIAAAMTFGEDGVGRREALTRTRIPILIICGDNDISTPAANWFPLIGKIPNAQIIIYPESGHGPQHQYPEMSAEYIDAFLNRALP